MEKEKLNVKTVAHHLGVSCKTIYRALKSGEIEQWGYKAHKEGREWVLEKIENPLDMMFTYTYGLNRRDI